MSENTNADNAAETMPFDPLATFDHVVVLMLENRSFDNLLGFLYEDGVPPNAGPGKKFAGVSTDLSNPVHPGPDHTMPPDGSNKIHVSKTRDYNQPYPDPGEEYYHVNVQLFDKPNGGARPPFNLPNPVPDDPPMSGFVTDYIEKLTEKVSKQKLPLSADNYGQIMQCFDRDAVPVLSKLAREFGVFDHWFCAVPSQTWCNRAFWHAGTSWGRVDNEPYEPWFKYNQGQTIFNQISNSGSSLSWKIYHQTPFVALTEIIHFRALKDNLGQVQSLDRFFEDCENGELPSYSFLEPNFLIEHNDYHPSSAGFGLVDYETWPGTVLLGERLVARIYNAVRNAKGRKDGSGSTSQNTLLIITFDEHGGCYDHVQPNPHVTPPDLSNDPPESQFPFDRSGIRVPMIMVSAHIAPNTIVNTPMLHTSFLNTVQAKWNGVAPGKFPPISNRQKSAEIFTEVFTAQNPRPAADWPDVHPPSLLATAADKVAVNPLSHPLNDLQRSIVSGTAAMLAHEGVTELKVLGAEAGASADGVDTVGDAASYLAQARKALDARTSGLP